MTTLYNGVIKLNYCIYLKTLQNFAKQLSDDVTKRGYVVEVVDLNQYDPEDNLADEVCIPSLTYLAGGEID